MHYCLLRDNKGSVHAYIHSKRQFIIHCNCLGTVFIKPLNGPTYVPLLRNIFRNFKNLKLTKMQRVAILPIER